ncbi:nuclear protein Es2 [Xylariomycetidae sp. FL0641]|nr:nuclear protein Es2 [Xylariomycetidae sp. FL0641]
MASHDTSSNSSKALVRKRDDLQLMPPPPPPKRIKRPKKVIDEDSYTDALSQIIARDFFPGLLESETQQEYLDALESKDDAWITSASRRLQHVMTPGRKTTRRGTSLAPGAQTPRGFVGDTPSSVAAESTTSTQKEKPEIDTNMSLSSFQSKYTSEDNESFYKLLDKQNSKRAEKYAWLWTGNKLPSKMQLKQKEVEGKLLENGSLVDDGFQKRDRLAIKDKDDRPARPDSWRVQPNNALMFTPESVEDSMETTLQTAEAQSKAAPKGVNYTNTRMPVPGIREDESVASSPSLSAVRDAIAGKRTSDAISTTAGSETPRVNGYAFVDDEEPAYEQPPPGKIDLGPGDATPNPFMIKEQSRREALHHRMVDRISQNNRTSSKLGMTGRPDKTPVPQFPSSPRVTGGLTPAAQRLWSKMGGSGGKTPQSPFGGQRTPMKGKGSRLKQVSK